MQKIALHSVDLVLTSQLLQEQTGAYRSPTAGDD